MRTSSYEHPINFALERIKSAPSKRDGKYKYRAHVVHEKYRGEPKDLDHEGDYYRVLAYLESICRDVMEDGVTRRLGDLFEVQLDIEGTFDRADEEYSPSKHNCRLNIVPLKGMKEYGRKERPINVQQPATGIIDYVETTGGEMYKLEAGKNILVHGETLTLAKGDHLRLTFEDWRGEKHEYYSYHGLTGFPEDIVVNSDDLLEVKWFGPKLMELRSLKPRNAVLYVTHGTRGDVRGSRAPVTLLA